MAKKPKQPNRFTGRWRIVSMSAWDQEFIDEEKGDSGYHVVPLPPDLAIEME